MAKAKDTTTKEEPLEKQLWKSADKLRKNIDAAEYKHVVLGLIFLKYISDSFEELYARLQIEVVDGADPEDREEYKAESVFFVPAQSRWGFLVAKAKEPQIGKSLDEAMDAIEKENQSLKGVLPKVYARPNLDPAALGGLIDLVGNIALGDLKSRSADVLGHVFEYFLGEFALAEGKKGGQFYTPRSVVELLVNMLEPYKGRVLDPCCGSGGMFVQCSKFVKEHRGKVDDISIYGQESNPGTWKMAKMNLAIRGLSGDLGDRNGDSFTDDLHKSLRADFILANPPYNIKDYWKPSLEGDPRWVFGKPDVKNANYAWLELMYAKLAPKGKAAILMPNGATTSNTEDDRKVRKSMLEAGKVDAIIDLPDKMFSNTGISVQCWILNKAKVDTDVLFINATKMGRMKTRKLRVFVGASDDDTFD